jgi:protein phosphatase PTC7
MGNKNSSAKNTAKTPVTDEFEWGESPEAVPDNERDPNDIVLQVWAFCKSKPSPVKFYRSDKEEKQRREALSWRKRSSFVELDCGEDSFFVSNTYRTVGVADGVGGWRDQGVDPAEFPNKLMKNAKLFSETHRAEFDPEMIMQKAFDRVVAKECIQGGSSTCCIASLIEREKKYFLDVANLGDSGVMVVRNRKVVHRVMEKVHGFNAPYQLAVLPPDMTNKAFADRVADCARESVEVKHGDVIVMGSDGLFDNMYSERLAAEAGWIGTVSDGFVASIPVIGFFLGAIFSASNQKVEYLDPQRVAQRIVQEAYKNSTSKDAATPWSGLLRSVGVENAAGGKVDDVTVVLARVSTREEASQGVFW